MSLTTLRDLPSRFDDGAEVGGAVGLGRWGGGAGRVWVWSGRFWRGGGWGGVVVVDGVATCGLGVLVSCDEAGVLRVSWMEPAGGRVACLSRRELEVPAERWVAVRLWYAGGRLGVSIDGVEVEDGGGGGDVTTVVGEPRESPGGAGCGLPVAGDEAVVFRPRVVGARATGGTPAVFGRVLEGLGNPRLRSCRAAAIDPRGKPKKIGTAPKGGPAWGEPGMGSGFWD